MYAVQTVKRLVLSGLLSAGGDRAGGPRGWRRRWRAARKERVKRRAVGARADPPPRAFHEVDGRRGPAETDPRPPASAPHPSPPHSFPNSSSSAYCCSNHHLHQHC